MTVVHYKKKCELLKNVFLGFKNRGQLVCRFVLHETVYEYCMMF